MADINQTAAWVTARLTELGNATNEGLNTLVTDANIGNYSAGNVSGVVSVANGGTGANNAVDGLENLGGIAASAVSTVGKTGDYDDLLNKPTIPTISQTYNASSADGMSGAAVAQGIAAETSRATTAEGNLNTAINTEKTRAQNAESTLNTAITTEKNRAEGAEATLTTSVDHLADNFADAYSASSTYYKGDYVIHDNILYVANQNISTAEAWTAAHWTQTSVEEIERELEEANANSLPTKSASGDVISITDGADNIPVKSLTVNVTAVQSGTGDPSPTNVRAISGWDTVDLARTEKNLFDQSVLLQATNWTFDGEYYTGKAKDLTTEFSTAFPGFDKPSGLPQLTISLDGYSEDSASSLGFYFAYSDGTSENTTSMKETTEAHYTWTTDASKTLVRVRPRYANNKTVHVKNFQIEVGSTATDYEPYVGETYTIQFGQTVYGGTLNPLTGVMTVTHKIFTFDGTNHATYGTTSAGMPYVRVGDPNCDSPAISNQYIYNAVAPSVGNPAVRVIRGSNIYIYDDRFTSESVAAELLAANPVQVVYPIIEPIEIQLTPVQITTLLGQNNVWADSGDISVIYRADPTLYIDGQIAPIKAMVASEETGTTASQAYTAGQYFILDGAFCKALTNIASGATFTLGTNYQATTIGAELYSALHS